MDFYYFDFLNLNFFNLYFIFIFLIFRVEGGELQRVLDEDDSIEESHCRRIMKQILEGVQFLHLANIAHLDIKVS